MSKAAERDQVIVFGGSGFLGSHVADALTAQGYKVRVFDRVPSAFIQENQEMITGDLMDLPAVIEAVKGCKYVYNFAGISDIEEASAKPVETANINVVGNTHVLEAARLAGAKRFLFASTVYVFSEAGSFYRASKHACEHFVESYFSRYNLPYTILRYGSLYGRRADARNPIYRYLKEALIAGEIHCTGTGEAMREYVHVQDAARLSVKVLEESYINRHVIVTGPERMPVKALVSMIDEMLPGDLKIHFQKDTGDIHYNMSPYTFSPKLGYKLASNEYIDIGQGLLDCLSEIYEEVHRGSIKEGDLFVEQTRGNLL